MLTCFLSSDFCVLDLLVKEGDVVGSVLLNLVSELLLPLSDPDVGLHIDLELGLLVEVLLQFFLEPNLGVINILLWSVVLDVDVELCVLLSVPLIDSLSSIENGTVGLLDVVEVVACPAEVVTHVDLTSLDDHDH